MIPTIRTIWGCFMYPRIEGRRVRANSMGAVRALFALSLLTLGASAQAAKIQHIVVSKDFGLITIEGDIVPGDVERFRQLSLRYPKAIVGLDSPGGYVMPAMEIGRLIRMAGFATLVPEDSSCVSSCALIWVAGTRRLMSPQGRVGFHASYLDNNGRLEESGVANALVGSYLTQLSFSQRAIVFATTASPTSVLWLTRANSEAAGIDFKDWVPKAQTAQAEAPPPPVIRYAPPQPAQAAPVRAQAQYLEDPITGEVDQNCVVIDPADPFTGLCTDPKTGKRYKFTYPEWLEYSSDNRGTVMYLNRTTMKKKNGLVTVWEKWDHSKDKSVSYRETKTLTEISCRDVAWRALFEVRYDSAGNSVLTEDYESKGSSFRRLVPDTVGMSLWEAVCR